ncbi:MAG: hypothetical protein KF817_13875 [Phycisphaeraceae bacterium]|nr:hypothetical protein [Phycisphaeraceae bacterium]
MTPTRFTISIGGLPKVTLLERLRNAGVEINAIGLELFEDDRFQTLDGVSVIALVRTTVADLGLRDGGVFVHVVQAARARGLALCPLEVGPSLRLVMTDQAEGARGFEQTPHRAPPGSITVLSPPLREDRDEYRGFYLRRIDGILWLRGFRAEAGHVWRPEDMLVLASVVDAP